MGHPDFAEGNFLSKFCWDSSSIEERGRAPPVVPQGARRQDDGATLHPDVPVCADDKGNNGELFCFIYTTLFKKVKLRFPFTRFERELLTELDIAAALLHPNSWAFVRAFQIMCAHLGLPASVDVFLFLFEAKHPGDRLWVSLNGIAGRSILSIF